MEKDEEIKKAEKGGPSKLIVEWTSEPQNRLNATGRPGEKLAVDGFNQWLGSEGRMGKSSAAGRRLGSMQPAHRSTKKKKKCSVRR